MNVAGKSLQDIYDAGSRRLSELEKSQKKQLGETADGHLDERKQAEPDSLKQLQERSGELEQEVRSYLTHGLERVGKVVESEATQTTKFNQCLVDGLDLLAKKFFESISQLRDAAENQLADLSSDHEQMYEASFHAADSLLTHEGTQLVDECRNEGCQTHGDLLGCVDESWQSILEQEDEVVADVLANFDSNAEQLNNKLQACQSKVDGDLSAKLSKLELRLMQATEAIRGVVDGTVEAADRHAFDSDVKLKERFSSLLYETTTSFEESSHRAVTEVANLHESSMADLTMRSQELSREMDGVVAGIAGGAADKLDKLCENGSILMSNYTNELNERRQSSETFQGELEKERADMVAEIWKELGEVKAGFETKLAAMAKTTLEKMRVVCEESEKAILKAQNACASESKQYAADKQKAIEQAATEFLARVNSTRDFALDAISKASGAGGDDWKSSEDIGSSASESSEEPESGEDEGNSGSTSATSPSESRRRRRAGKQSDKRGEGKK